MEEEENVAQEMTSVKQGYEVETAAQEAEAARKAHNAAKQRERTERLRALGLNARGMPPLGTGSGRPAKRRNPAKQRKYQANFSARHKAARERLGLTIAEFNKLPKATRMMEMKGVEITDRSPSSKEKQRAKQRAWYHRNKAKQATVEANNGVRPATDRSIKFCPHCGWNIDATRKAQAFMDGRTE